MLRAEPKEFKKITIVGAGPMGMFTALELAKLGLKITLIEKRTHYTRPGNINKSVFELLEKELKAPIMRSPASHIKDIERSLEKLIEKQDGIELKRGSFSKIVPHGIEINTESGLEICLCDLVLDATGTQRAVVHSLNHILKKDNKEISQNHFSILPISNNPIKTHFIAHVKIDTAKISDLVEKCKTVYLNPHANLTTKELIGIAKLSDEFGWPHFCIPQLIMHDASKNKVLIYLEMPHQMSHLKQELWIKRVIHLITGKNIDYTHLRISDKYKNHPKPRFNEAKVQAKETVPTYYLGTDFPSVVPIGDACIEPDYRLGIGMMNGIQHSKLFISCIDVKTLKFNFAKYSEEIRSSITLQKKYFDALYSHRNKNTHIDDNVFFKLYSEIPSQKDRKLILDAKTKIFSLEQKK